MAENPLNFIADNQNNPFERAKKAVGEKVGGFFGSETGQAAIEKAEPVLSKLEYLATPYREYAAPALTSVLLTLNSNYREQNKNLSIVDQVKRGFTEAKKTVEGEDEYRRSVSPGRAMVGLIGSMTPGRQGVDKINWSDSRQVNDFFTSGSAQFWSGVADLGFNAVDPVAFGIGKGTSLTRKMLVTRPVTSRMINPERLAAEVDEAVVNKASNTGAAQIFKLVEQDPNNVAAIQAYGMVAASANPAGFAVALSEAYKLGGRQLMGDVMKSSIGNLKSMEKLKSQYQEVHALMLDNTGKTELLNEDLAKLNTSLSAREDLTKPELDSLLARKDKVKEAIKAAEAAKEEAAYKSGVLERTQAEFGVTQTWSQSTFLERIRTGVARISSDGIFLEVDPTKKFQVAKALGKELGTGTLPIRAAMWVSPNQQLREVQSGIAYLGGTAGERSFLEADARIATVGRLTGMAKEEMKSLSTQYRTLRSKSERFTFLDKLQENAFNGLLKKYYGQEIGRMSPVQQEAATVFVRELIEGTRRAQARQINNLVEKKYTVMDHANGDVVAHPHMEAIVKKLAEDKAREEGRPVKDYDFQFVKRTLQENQLTETQVPNVHFGVDIKMFDQIMSENPTLIGNMMRGILDNTIEASDVRRIMGTAERNAMERANGNGSVFNELKPMVRTAKDVAADGIDQLYTYVWKPFTLLSLKYTTRNVFEGHLRILASMVDFHSYYGYGWTDMFSAVRDPGSISRTLQNRGLRKRSTAAQNKFNERLNDLQREENLLRKQLGEVTESNRSIAYKLRNKSITEADKKIFEGSDGMSMTLMYTKNLLSKIEKTKSSGVKGADDTLRTLRENLVPLLNGEGDYGSDAGNQFIKFLTSGEYRKASEISASSNTGDIIKALSKFRDEVGTTVQKLNGHNAGGAESVSYMLDNSKYALNRMLLHADLTLELLVNRGRIVGDIKELGAEITGAGAKKLAFGTKQVKISDFDGGIYVDASLAGEAGEMLRRATSSKVSTTRVLMDERNITGYGLMSQGFERRPVSPYDVQWTEAHADYVNNVMMRDAAIRNMVENLASGMTRDEAIDATKVWIRSTDPEAANWRREIKQNMTTMSNALDTKFSYDEQLALSYVQIEQHLPSASSITGQGYQNLYKKAVEGFTAEDSARIAIQDRFEVVTARELTDKRLSVLYKNGVSRVFNWIGTLPEDHLVRHPFFNMVYNNEARRIATKYERMGRSNGLSDVQIAELIKTNVDKISTAASQRAYKELMQRLYSVERYTGPAKMLRWVTPFYMAHQNSSRFWLGTSLRSPQVAYNLAKAYNAPYRLGLVTDEEGNVVHEGLPWNPDANKQKMTFKLAALKPLIGKDTLTTSPVGIDVITQGQLPILPTLGGPAGEIVGTQLIKYISESTDADKFLREQFGVGIDAISSKYILPFYEKGYGKGVLSSAYSSTVPFNSSQLSLLSSIYGMTGALPIVQDLVPQVRQRWAARYDAARDEVVADMLLRGEGLNPDVINERATSIARRSLLFESLSSGIGPVVAFKAESSQMRDLNQRLTAYQNEFGYNEGSVKMIAELENQGIKDASGIVSTLRSSTSNNRFGLYSNIATIKGVEKNIDSFSTAAQYYEDNPFLGELFNQVGDNTYSPIADDLLYSIKVNGEPLKSKDMSPEDAERQAQMRAGWATYFDNLEFIEADAERNGVKKGSKLYNEYYKVWKENLADAVGKQYPVWDTRDNRITLQKSDKFIELGTYFVNDKQFMATVGNNNEAIKGLEIYLREREIIMAELEVNRQRTGTYGLDSKANEYYAEWRDNLGEAIAADYPGFKQMWTRYLSQDELNYVSSPILNGVK